MTALVIGGAIYFSRPPSELEQFRAELRSKGYKIGLQEYFGDKKPPRRGYFVYKRPPEDIQKLISAGEQLDKLNVKGWQFGVLPIIGKGSAGYPVPLIRRKSPWWGASYTTLTNQTWEDLAEVMKQAESTLQKIRAQVRVEMPEHRLGASTPVFTFLNTGFWLTAHCLDALRHGSRTMALDDLEGLLDLAQIGGREKHGFPQQFRITVIQIGLMLTWEMLQSAEWTELELSRIEGAWERVFPLSALEVFLEYNLAYAGDIDSVVTQELATGSMRDRVVAMVGRIDRKDDALFLLKYALAHLDAARNLQNGEIWASLKPGLDKLQSSASSKSNSRYRHLAVRMCGTSAGELFVHAVRVEAGRQLLLTDVAIRRFKLSHNGTPPKTLRELSPDLLEVVNGRDPFSGGDLQYCANLDGSYLIYSIGPDGVDDSGDSSVGQGQHYFWSSRDIVWPSCP